MTTVVHALEALEGGTARHVVDLVRHVRGVTHHVVVPQHRVGGVTDWRAVPAMRDAGAEIHRVEMRRLPVSPRNASALVGLRTTLRRIRPNVVHGHSAIGGALARAAAADLTALRVYTPNGLHPSPIATIVERGLRPFTDRFVAVSPSEGLVALARGITDRDHLVVIPNGIEISQSPDNGAPGGASSPEIGPPPDLRRWAGVSVDVPVVGFVGRLSPQKAPEVIVELADLLRRRRLDVHFVLIGSGRRDAQVRNAISERGLDSSVHIVSHVARARRVMDQLAALVLPSRYEGCPYTVLEAMDAGTPVIVSDAVGNRDLVTDGVTGRVVRTGDVSGMADALQAVLEDSREARRMADAARSFVAIHHDVGAMADAVSEVYSGGSGSARPTSASA